MTDWIKFRINEHDIYIHVPNISEIRYNSYTRIMTITMNNRDEYKRTNVSIEEFNDLKKVLDCI